MKMTKRQKRQLRSKLKRVLEYAEIGVYDTEDSVTTAMSAYDLIQEVRRDVHIILREVEEL